MSSTSQVWFITGAAQSTGLGHEIALAALARGDKVILAIRSSKSEHLQQLQDAHPDACHVIQMNVAENFDAIFAKAQEAIAVWGKIDVVVNNAGHYYWGNIEEIKGEGFKEVYNTNVFGMINVTNAFLPHMRTRRSGTVVFISSRSAWRTMAVCYIVPSAPFIKELAEGTAHFHYGITATYASSKAAINAISDILALELKPLNIRVLNVVPGAIRTGAMNRIQYPAHRELPYEDGEGNLVSREVPEYTATMDQLADIIERSNGLEPGEPKKAASIITDVVRGEGVALGRAWPGTLYLGGDGEAQIRNKCAEILKTLDEWRDITRSIEFDCQN